MFGFLRGITRYREPAGITVMPAEPERPATAPRLKTRKSDGVAYDPLLSIGHRRSARSAEDRCHWSPDVRVPTVTEIRP